MLRHIQDKGKIWLEDDEGTPKVYGGFAMHKMVKITAVANYRKVTNCFESKRETAVIILAKAER